MNLLTVLFSTQAALSMAMAFISIFFPEKFLPFVVNNAALLRFREREALMFLFFVIRMYGTLFLFQVCNYHNHMKSIYHTPHHAYR